MRFNARLGVVSLAGVTTLAPLVAATPAHAEQHAPSTAAVQLAAQDHDGSSSVTSGGVTLTLTPAGQQLAKQNCINLWKPYGKKIRGTWYSEGGARLSNCGATYFKVTLQQKRWWGWSDRSKKTITRSGDANPRVKCKSFKKGTWRMKGTWYRNTSRGVETLALVATKNTSMRCK